IGTCGSNPEGLLTIIHCLSRHLSRTLPPFLAPLAIKCSSSHSLTKQIVYIRCVNCELESPPGRPCIFGAPLVFLRCPLRSGRFQVLQPLCALLQQECY